GAAAGGEGDKHGAGAPEGTRGGEAGKPGGAGARAAAGPTRIDFDGFQSRIVAVQSVPERQYAHLVAGAAGTVYYPETPAGRPAPTPRGFPPRFPLERFKPSERNPAVFATEVADFAVSADGRKLVYRAAAPPVPPPPPGLPAPPPVPPNLFLV